MQRHFFEGRDGASKQRIEWGGESGWGGRHPPGSEVRGWRHPPKHLIVLTSGFVVSLLQSMVADVALVGRLLTTWTGLQYNPTLRQWYWDYYDQILNKSSQIPVML